MGPNSNATAARHDGFDQLQEVSGLPAAAARTRLTLGFRFVILFRDGDGVPREPPQRLMTPASVLGQGRVRNPPSGGFFSCAVGARGRSGNVYCNNSVG